MTSLPEFQSFAEHVKQGIFPSVATPMAPQAIKTLRKVHNPLTQAQGRATQGQVATGLRTSADQGFARRSMQGTAQANVRGSVASPTGRGGTSAFVARPSAKPIAPQQPKIPAPKTASADPELLEELLKVARMSERDRRHRYYMQNRQRILQQNRQYRQKNKASISRKQKRYRKQVTSGMRKQKRRINTGGHSYQYGGWK